jgi:hypothetical protein
MRPGVGRYVKTVIPSNSFSLPYYMFLAILWFTLRFLFLPIFKLCNALVEFVLYVFTCLVPSRCLISKQLSVWPMYEQLHVVNFKVYMPLEFFVSCGDLLQR